MTLLTGKKYYSGRHYETGSIHNALATQGVRAPHTGEPYSEPLLLGISGGIAVGYFQFHYEGHLPHTILLTRNTFDPMNTILQRLGIVQDILQTSNPEKGLRNLLDTLENGRPAIVWADFTQLPYNALPANAGYWGMLPLVVYGHDGEQATLADGSSQPLVVSAAELAAGRARVKKDKFRVLSLNPPRPEKLPAAVTAGIWDCIRLFTEKPPRGTGKNFGLSGLENLAKMLTNTRNPQSWARALPPGPALFAALAGHESVPGLYGWIQGWGDGGAERARYADFLDEAAVILERPALREIATLFRHSHKAWAKLADLTLPHSIPALAEARQLLDRRARLFWERGTAALEEIRAVAQQQANLHARMTKEFPLDEAGAADLRQTLSEQVLVILEHERAAVAALREAMS